jgi:membrane-associated phospholipid phosphatase
MQIGDRAVRRLAIAASAIYLAVLLVFFVIYHVPPGPEFFIVFVLIYALSRSWTQRFVRDWIPFIILFVGYEAMYGIAYKITGVVHITELIDMELRIFGFIPTLVLQQFYRSPVLDFVGSFLYSLHFVIPVAFGFTLWRYLPDNFPRFTAALMLCVYSALITFLVYPSAPPWYGVKAINITSETTQSLGLSHRSLFDLFDVNPFAAFPSLHSAFPWLVSLYAVKIKRAKALPILALPVGIWFSAVYLGQHYVVDVIGGVTYSTCAYLIVEKLVPRLHSPFSASKIGIPVDRAA